MNEAARIEQAYAARDAGPGIYSASDPAVRLHLAELERTLLGAVDLRGARVLDVGCGTGDILARLVALGAASGAGIDLVEGRIAAGREEHPDLDLRRGDASSLPWEDGAFGLVAQFTCISSVLDPGMRAAILGEMWRVVAPGGALLSYDLRPSPAPIRAAGALVRGTDPMPVEPLTLAEIRAGLPTGTAIEARTVSLNFALAPVARRSPAAAGLLARVPALRSHVLAVARK